MIAGFALGLVGTMQATAIDWESLPLMPWRAPPQINAQMNGFVASDAKARDCPLPPAEGPNQTLSVELAVLVDAQGDVRTVTPRAIGCPTVEQYAAGLVASLARGNLLPRNGGGEQWYKTGLTFSWPK